MKLAKLFVDALAVYFVRNRGHYTNIKYALKQVHEVDGERVVKKLNLVPIKKRNPDHHQTHHTDQQHLKLNDVENKEQKHKND